MSKWLTSKEFRKKYNISSATLWRRVNVAHTIQKKEMYGVVYYYDEDDVICNNESSVIYCRIYNNDSDLLTQEKNMREYCISNGIKIDNVYTDNTMFDIHSCVSFKELLKSVIDYKVDVVYIPYKECFGYNYDLINYLFSLFNTKIIDLNQYNYKFNQEEIKNNINDNVRKSIENITDSNILSVLKDLKKLTK